MKKNVLTYTIPALMCAALIAAVLWGRSKAARAAELEAVSEEYIGYCVSACSETGRELAEAVRSMQTSLEKLRVTGSFANRVLALEDIVRESAEAGKLICRLPRSQIEIMELEAFLARTGDYARSVSKRILNGGELEESDTEQLGTMLDAVQSLAERLDSMIQNGEMPVGTEEYDYYDTDSDGPSGPGYPTLVYDGPFSESAENAQPLGSTGEEGSEDEARAIAERVAGTPLEFTGRTEGRIPTYDFSGGGADISITVRGLFVKYYRKQASGDASGMPDEAGCESLAKAGAAFLDSLGYTDMEPTRSEYNDGTALISYAWKTGDVTVYNDMINVWIDRDTGEPVGLDAGGYLFSHRERDTTAPLIDGETAKRSVSSMLGVTSVKGLALIPVTPLTEALCWEIRGECGGCEYAVFINALTGAEEAIFRIVRDDCSEKAV